MYEITRKKRLTEQLVLKNEDVQAVVDVDLDLLGDAKEFRAKYVGLVNAQKALQDAKSASGSHNLEEAHKQIGRSICELLEKTERTASSRFLMETGRKQLSRWPHSL